MTTSRLSRVEPWPTPRSAPHAEPLHRRFVENLDLDAEPFEFLGAFGEGCGIEHIGRLVDERAGEHHPVGDSVAAPHLRAGARDVLDRDPDRESDLLVLRPRLFFLVL